jgi:hypothetical protein
MKCTPLLRVRTNEVLKCGFDEGPVVAQRRLGYVGFHIVFESKGGAAIFVRRALAGNPRSGAIHRLTSLLLVCREPLFCQSHDFRRRDIR